MVSNLRKFFLCIFWHQKPTVKKNEHTRRIHCTLVSRDGVFIDGNSNILKDSFRFGATKFDIAQINQNYVIVSTIGDNFVSQVFEIFAKSLSICNHRFLIGSGNVSF